MNRNPVILIMIFAGVFNILNGQDVNVRTSFDSSRIYVGDQIHFTVTVDQPSGIKLELPVLKDTLCRNIEIISGPFADTSSSDDNRLKIVSKYLITSFDSGYYEVPPLYAEIRDESGIKRFYSGYSALEVMRVNIAPADSAARIFDILEPYKAPLSPGEILPWVLLIMAIAGLIWLAVRVLRKLKKRTPEADIIVNPDPAHVIAFRDLTKLRDEQLWQKGEVKLYYSKLTEILRQYLENRYGVYSLEMTTSETLEALLRTGFKKDQIYAKLKSVLNGSDLVKFAKYKPDPVENDVHFQDSWDFVESTMIKEEIPSADSDQDKSAEK